MKTQRPPIVTVLGHVDHGKTTLLDAIRKTNIAAREAGGITQGIGASQIETKEGKITFVDTPGHAAFSKMRARGAKIADIAILVVAADDGMMPQTKEALDYILANKIPMIVAFTKMDLPSANIEKARGQLEQEGVYFEGRGGQTSSVEVSGKTGKGIDELLELIYLTAGVSEISGDAVAPLSASVIETNKDKRGTLVSVVVKEGTLKVHDDISAGAETTRVKGLFNEKGAPVKEAEPGYPVAILGFTESPEVGSVITLAGSINTPKVNKEKENKKVLEGQLGIILKAQTAGALEAINALLPKDAIILSSAIGDVSESDVFFAKTAGAIIVTFEAKVSSAVAKLADTEGVEIASFKIIYELSQFVEKKIKDLTIAVLGKAQILAEFPFNKIRVAGCKILEGRIQKSDNIVLMRGEKQIGEAKVVSVRRGKNDISEAKAGEECGVIISPQLDFQKDDILVATVGARAKKVK